MKNLAKQNLRVLLIVLLTVLQLPVFAGNAKLHIATNKENYAASETVQFQVFLLNPSEKVNNTLFVELWDCAGNKLSSQMLPFNFNISSGYINLPEAGKPEFYLLHCYVNNTDSMECSSIKKIFIAGPPKKPGNTIKIDHYFEGGSFVAESPNNILVHCTDENGNPVIAKGKVTDGKMGIYAVFETNELGFAKIIMNPEDKVRYLVEVKDNNNREGISPLRMASSSGITLNTSLSENSIIYNLISYSSMTDQLPEYRIEALYNGQIIYDAALNFQNGLSAVKEEIKKDAIPAGLIIFRVVDRSNKIYAQRILYNSVMPASNNFITIVDTITKKEAKIILPGMISGKSYINIKKADADAAGRNDLNFLEVTDRISINDQLIAAEDLPNSFNAVDDNTNRYLSLTGTLMDYEKKPVKNKNVNLVIQHKNMKKQYLVSKTDAAGKLQVNNLVFFDSATVYYQLADKSEEKNDLYMTDQKVSPVADYANAKKPALNFICAVGLPASQGNDIIKPEEKTLNQVVINTNAPKTESEKYADKYVSAQMKRSHALRNEIDFIKNPEVIDNRSLWVYIQGRIPSLRVFITPQGNPVLSGSNGGTVGVYLNDMELPLDESLSFLNNLQVKDVAQVKFYSMSFKPKLIGGNMLTDLKAADGGDLLIYTKRDYNSEEKTKGLPKTTIVGYTMEKPSVDPVTDNPGSLFWKPEWKVESGQRIFIGLPPADAAKNIEIIIEGINTDLAPYRFTQKLVFN